MAPGAVDRVLLASAAGGGAEPAEEAILVGDIAHGAGVDSVDGGSDVVSAAAGRESGAGPAACESVGAAWVVACVDGRGGQQVY